MIIEMLENEYWWGGAVDKAVDMPISNKTKGTISLFDQWLDAASPIFLSNKGRIIASDKPFIIECSDGNMKIDCTFDVKLYDGYGDLKGAVKKAFEMFYKKDGKIVQEEFLKLPQYNTWMELGYGQNQESILEYAENLLKFGMPPGIFMIDEGWSEDYGVFDFYPGRFHNPKEMIKKLHDMGFIVMLWVVPHISPDSNAFRELRKTNCLLKNNEGKPAIREWWNGYSCVLDLSGEEAKKWFKQKLDDCMEKYGVDGFKFDSGGSLIYRDDDKAQTPCIAHEQTRNFDLFSKQYAYNELRAIWNMGGEPIVCRLQDKFHSWNEGGLNMLIPCMLTQGMLGYYFGCPDMVGGGAYDVGEVVTDKELYIRWLEASTLCPMMQISRGPWHILNDEEMKYVEKLSVLHKKFGDYILELARNAVITGEPIMRHMEYEFPNCGYEETVDMFMLGDKYLIAPVLLQGQTSRKVRLPKGEWKDDNGILYQGDCEIEIQCPIDRLAYFEKIN